jgi:hypothetical protein
MLALAVVILSSCRHWPLLAADRRCRCARRREDRRRLTSRLTSITLAGDEQQRLHSALAVVADRDGGGRDRTPKSGALRSRRCCEASGLLEVARTARSRGGPPLSQGEPNSRSDTGRPYRLGLTTDLVTRMRLVGGDYEPRARSAQMPSCGPAPWLPSFNSKDASKPSPAVRLSFRLIQRRSRPFRRDRGRWTRRRSAPHERM